MHAPQFLGLRFEISGLLAHFLRQLYAAITETVECLLVPTMHLRKIVVCVPHRLCNLRIQSLNGSGHQDTNLSVLCITAVDVRLEFLPQLLSDHLHRTRIVSKPLFVLFIHTFGQFVQLFNPCFDLFNLASVTPDFFGLGLVVAVPLVLKTFDLGVEFLTRRRDLTKSFVVLVVNGAGQLFDMLNKPRVKSLAQLVGFHCVVPVLHLGVAGHLRELVLHHIAQVAVHLVQLLTARVKLSIMISLQAGQFLAHPSLHVLDGVL
mmetsp:Transcript_55651/g.148431  ORF Transcript_55651/g.148431 Transcript_55651/m.148431 type:complete len:262 (-) Transcript_55651:2208-2993(-)